MKKKDFIEYLDKNLICPDFKRHCIETAEILKISPELVKDVIYDHAYQVLSTAQEEVLKRRKIKINIYGFYYIVIQPTKKNYKYVKIRNHEFKCNDNTTIDR